MIETDVTVERAVAAIRAATRPPLGELRAIAAALQAHIAAALTSPQRAAFDFTPELLLPFLERQSPLIDGAGIAYSPGAFADQPTWVDWWHFDDERPTHIPYDLNPRSIGYYDYASREWFQAPRDLGRPVAIGPYVDSGGIFLNTVRLALPVPTASGTHTLGCDLSLTRLESLFVHALAAVDPPLALVGGAAGCWPPTRPGTRRAPGRPQPGARGRSSPTTTAWRPCGPSGPRPRSRARHRAGQIRPAGGPAAATTRGSSPASPEPRRARRSSRRPRCRC